MKTKAETVVQRQLDAYNAHDISGFMSTYATDIKIKKLISNEISLSGSEAVKEHYEKLFTMEKLHAEIANRMVLGNFVIDYEQVSITTPDEFMEVVVVYEVTDDLIKNVWMLSQDQ